MQARNPSIQIVDKSPNRTLAAAIPGILLLVSCLLAASPAAQASAPSLLLPWILLGGQTGCADLRKSGECPNVDYVPAGTQEVTPGNFDDEDIGAVLEACNPAVIGLGWLDQYDPVLPPDCEDLILEGLPLSAELESPTTDEERATRGALARALHALLFLPLADPGAFLGSTDSKDYCPGIYQDFFGAVEAAPGDLNRLNAIAYQMGDAPTGKHLVQFILERTDEFRFEESYQDEDGDGSTVLASERLGTIRLGPAFAGETNAIVLASMLVHESRHTAEGFQDGSSHVTCSYYLPEESLKICDETNFGSYGASAAYVDAALRGGIRSLVGSRPLLSLTLVRFAYYSACSKYLERIENRSDSLPAYLEASTCDPGEEDLRRVLAEIYGMNEADVLVR